MGTVVIVVKEVTAATAVTVATQFTAVTIIIVVLVRLFFRFQNCSPPKKSSPLIGLITFFFKLLNGQKIKQKLQILGI